ncbi:hypothetical protein ABPG74_009824 [Tetrahymena malaccensis]
MSFQSPVKKNKFPIILEELSQSFDELEVNEKISLPLSLVNKNTQNYPINQQQTSQKQKLTSLLQDYDVQQSSQIDAQKLPLNQKNIKTHFTKPEFLKIEIYPTKQKSEKFEDFTLQESQRQQNYEVLSKTSKKTSYDLEKNLIFEIKTLKKHFQFSNKHECTIPIMVSVNTQDQIQLKDQKEYVKQQINLRPSIDLVCVIDNSASMRGEKIKNVKETLLNLVEMLNSNDRLSLILFNNDPITLFDLKYADNNNKQTFKKKINQISSHQGTDIHKGMVQAFKILQQRQSQNQVSSIFLLSDGIDSRADIKIQNYIKSQIPLQNECFTIHSFGYGSNHDAELMYKICSLKNGNFYYISDINKVDQYFADALGGLFSVVAQEITIELQLNRNDQNFQKYFSNCRVSKTYGDVWKCVKQDEIYQIKINQLFQGTSKDFIMELTVPKNDVNMLQDFERNLEILKGQLTAIPIDCQYTTKIVKDSNLMLTLFLQNERIPIDSEIDSSVEFNYLRVQAAMAIDSALNLSENKQFSESELILTHFLGKLEKHHLQNQEKIEILKRDILDCIKCTQSINSNKESKTMMLSKKYSNYNQSSQVVDLDDIYQSIFQKQTVSYIKTFKMNQPLNK